MANQLIDAIRNILESGKQGIQRTNQAFVPPAMQQGIQATNQALTPPPVDLGKINIVKPAEAATVPPVAQQGAQPQTGGGIDLKELLVRLGIPLAATGIGLGVPGALPGAAGFSKGFVGEQQRQKEAQEKQEIDIKKTKAKKLEGFRKEARKLAVDMVRNFESVDPKQFTDQTEQLFQAIAEQEGLTELQGKTKKKIRIERNGVPGTIDEDEFDPKTDKRI